MTTQLYGQQLALDSTKNVKVLPFDQGPHKVLVLSCSSLECLPFDHGPNQVLMLCQVNENVTLKVIHHLNIHSAHDPNLKNIHLEPLNEKHPVVIKSLQKTLQDLSSTLLDHGETNAPAQNSNDNADASTMDIIDLQDQVGCTFLMEKHADGQHFCACSIECIELMDFIQKNVENTDIVWKFWRIIGYQGPHKPSDSHYMGSCFSQMFGLNGRMGRQHTSPLMTSFCRYG